MSRFLSNAPKPYDTATAVNFLTARQQTVDVTLDNSSTTTTVEDARISENSIIILMPVSADSATEAPYYTVTGGQVVITHTNDVTTREFKMGIIG